MPVTDIEAVKLPSMEKTTALIRIGIGEEEKKSNIINAIISSILHTSIYVPYDKSIYRLDCTDTCQTLYYSHMTDIYPDKLV